MDGRNTYRPIVVNDWRIYFYIQVFKTSRHQMVVTRQVRVFFSVRSLCLYGRCRLTEKPRVVKPMFVIQWRVSWKSTLLLQSPSRIFQYGIHDVTLHGWKMAPARYTVLRRPSSGARWSVTSSPPDHRLDPCVRQVKTNSAVDGRSWCDAALPLWSVARYDDVTRGGSVRTSSRSCCSCSSSNPHHWLG